MVINDFVNWTFIESFMGAVIITMLIVQFTKELKFIKNIPTKYYTFIVAFVNLTICQIISGKFALANLYLLFVNAIIVTFTSTGGYDFTMKSIKFKNDTDTTKNEAE